MLKNFLYQRKENPGISTGDYIEKSIKSNDSSVSSLFLHDIFEHKKKRKKNRPEKI